LVNLIFFFRIPSFFYIDDPFFPSSDTLTVPRSKFSVLPLTRADRHLPVPGIFHRPFLPFSPFFFSIGLGSWDVCVSFRTFLQGLLLPSFPHFAFRYSSLLPFALDPFPLPRNVSLLRISSSRIGSCRLFLSEFFPAV